MPYRVRDYHVDDFRDAERLAAMFNDFDSAWPGGFNRGTPDIPERIQESMGRKRRVAILVAECDEEFVGFCDLEAQTGQTETAFVPLLGARLAHHGKGVGKMLLREIVRRATEAGYKQVTLYTWPGNTKAVPLYKKTGFNWVPETDVFMRNYMPSALTIPAGKAFFANRDWYDCFDREIQVAPDDVTWKGMKVYPYRFRAGDDFLNLTFDANAHGLTAIETPAYSLACYVPVEEAPAGETFPITWEIAARAGKPLDVTLLTEADPGLELSVQERFIVDGEMTLTRNLRVAADAVPRRYRETAHRVRSTLLINGQPVVLETGVKVVRPVEIQYGGQALFAGKEETITVTLQSKLERPLSGRLVLEAHPAIACDRPACDFTLGPRLRTQCQFRVTAKESGVFTTQLKFTAGETQGARPVAFRAFGNGVSVLASIDAIYDENAMLESPGLRVIVGLRGGYMNLQLPTRDRGVMGQDLAELGPPFVDWRMNQPLYTARVDTTPEGTALTLTAPSKEFPGLTVERSVTILSGDLVRVESRVYNTSDQTLSTKLLLETNPWLHHYVTAPTPHGLIREPLWGEAPQGDTDLMAHETAYMENWAALEEDGFVCGLLWEGEPKQELGWSPLPKLTYDLGELPPYSVRAVPPVYLVAGTGDWETVRAWWRRLIQPAETGDDPRLETMRVLEVRTEPSPALLQSAQADVALQVLNRRGKALTGTLALTGDSFRAEPSEFALEAVDRDRPFATTVHLAAPDAPSAGALKAVLNDGANVTDFSVPLIRMGAGETLSVTPAENNTFVVENGCLRLRIAPEFLGSIIALEQNGVNHLLSAYPQSRPFVWTNPWFGGIHAFLGGFSGDVRLTRETFAGEPVERIGERGLRWQGVRLVCAPKHKDVRWLRLEAEYLTLPGSNIVALVSRWTNRNTARTETGGGMAVWPQVGGTRENTVAYWDFKGERHERRRGGFGMQALSGPWVALENPQTRDVLLLIASAPRAHTGFYDYREEGVHLFASGPMHFEPNETKEVLSWLVLCRDVKQTEAYAALAKVRGLP